ncbi:predicted protein [Sclerotinia sclerotiorum 1980 UF-70]|uniref:Uncharacterized protein n=1 Tax=Sclerotinia sclerotiorum (strain ATCC 18683 / 1980 / Ss-1) TaxID=665079 RepID=A7EAL2_SCLS1|nr:predicted protein [Sclerotinia sclerotiorum 1980 UF-70]EDN99490.1 predicted protein [Sclerotinia sclerotiorum 1980 UF-70]
MKVTTIHLATLVFGFANYTTVTAQTKAQIVSSCQSQNPNNAWGGRVQNVEVRCWGLLWVNDKSIIFN